MAELQAPKGVPEYFGPRGAAFRAVREALSLPPQRAGYGYVELPVFEDTALYVRGVGESTDVVAKEMYTFEDRGGRSLSLRPEGTAGVMRLAIEHSLDRGQLPVKVWYAGPFFRAERPQQGRYRQLQQVGLEAIGSSDPLLDAEVIALADEGFRSLGLVQFTLQLTSLGCRECRPGYRELLQGFLARLDLDDATRERAAINPLRVLDDKRASVQQQLEGVPYMVDHLCADCSAHYDAVRDGLRRLGVQWTEAPALVRGLDYYTRTAFEFTHHLLGAQSGIGGGGRYDGLMSSLGGQDLPGIGWGLGTDRTLLACDAEGLAPGAGPGVDVFGVPMGDEARGRLLELGHALRGVGVRFDLAFGERGLKSAMKAADRSGAPLTLIVGDQEIAAGTAVLRDMASGAQEQVPWESVQPIVLQRLDSSEGTTT
ncbi:MAG: histidine--tRNA ligase [Candidatus Nanopelagicales bacterium]|nr:histidine--tRNA ligase [Candidatus Nanopelagicales bacterium]